MAPLAEMTANGQDEALLDDGPSLQDAFKAFRMRKRQQQRQVPTKELRAKAANGARRIPWATRQDCGPSSSRNAWKASASPTPSATTSRATRCTAARSTSTAARLFRKALRQLRPDFGFDIGPWNQAYLFATLPRKLELSEVRPGDLLFVEGTYFKGRKKQQKGNIVHVEMYLGAELGSGPESTLASRDHWGCVSIQDSFKYVSPWYEITALHWRSLDDWLEGRCDPVAMPDCFTGPRPVWREGPARREEVGLRRVRRRRRRRGHRRRRREAQGLRLSTIRRVLVAAAARLVGGVLPRVHGDLPRHAVVELYTADVGEAHGVDEDVGELFAHMYLLGLGEGGQAPRNFALPLKTLGELSHLADERQPVWKPNLILRVDLHAIDAPPARRDLCTGANKMFRGVWNWSQSRSRAKSAMRSRSASTSRLSPSSARRSRAFSPRSSMTSAFKLASRSSCSLQLGRCGGDIDASAPQTAAGAAKCRAAVRSAAAAIRELGCCLLAQAVRAPVFGVIASWLRALVPSGASLRCAARVQALASGL